MIAGGSVEILKNRIAEEIFDRRFDQRGRRADAASDLSPPSASREGGERLRHALFSPRSVA